MSVTRKCTVDPLRAEPISVTIPTGKKRREHGDTGASRVRSSLAYQALDNTPVALQRLTGRIAHDFNNLLSVIMASVDLLELELDSHDRCLEPLRDIELAACRGAELVKQLTAYGRQQLLQPVVVDLNDEIAQLGPEIQRTVGDRIKVKVRLEDEPACVRIDPVQFRRVVLNLVENARDAMPSGGTLTIDVEKLELAGFDPAELSSKLTPSVMVAVSDTGVGMGKHTRAHAFEPFFTTKAQGTGMGLASVRGIVGQSGGAVWLDSSPDQGTTLALYFPRVAAANPCVPDDDHWDVAKGPAGDWILLVDDDATVRRSVGRLLQVAGFKVVQAGLPTEALAVAQEYGARLGLVLTDVEMPEMSGMALVDRLRCSIPNLRAIYMSGYPAEALGDLDQAKRCHPFVQKPMGETELLATIRATLGGQTLPPPSGPSVRDWTKGAG